ncbi:hypothetical protein PISMIDRAFT_356591 [Pisolithus microcarpus 441]|uniref:CRIB domain-containing protein n=1 Tax=Pisolithus microcarpus 441 TaxID=765257 RepID=A0A0C9Z7F0_9AGAM|nr:hypothetical protein PISMIDRAFT_356591 [Pisolithus microcarpus 441]
MQHASLAKVVFVEPGAARDLVPTSAPTTEFRSRPQSSRFFHSTNHNRWLIKIMFRTASRVPISSRRGSLRSECLNPGLRLAQLVRLRTQSARLHSLDASHTPPKTDSPSLPPPPPPKDNAYSTSSNFLSNPPSALYTKSLFSRSVNSLSHSLGRAPSQGQPLSPDSNPITPLTTGSFGAPQHGSTGSQTGILGRGMTASPVPSGSGVSLNSANGDMNATKRKKPLFKLSSLGLKNKSRRDLSETASMSTSTSEYEESGKEEGDEGISVPWNFQHHIHVDEGYIGLPPSWATALSSAGFGDEEIAAIHARRKAAAAANLKNGYVFILSGQVDWFNI